MRVIAHGGAGAVPDDPDARQAVLDRAAETGATAPTPLDAVESTVRTLESNPRFNAGVGGAVQSDGVVRTDAGVMTSDRAVGAACSLPGVEHAVSVARVVMRETPHVLLSGDHAVALADEFDVGTGVDILTDGTRAAYESASPPDGGPADHLDWLEARFGDGTGSNAPDHDTVGAVASDGATFAAATSTGGRWFALAGRVGDVPQVGSGFYCGPAGGASATGAGEDIARVTLARRAVDRLDAGASAQSAAEAAITAFADETGSTAGLIVLDAEGVGSAYNSDAMQTAVAER